ncbi:TIGR03086 family metal-binding protein [Glycomyces sp. NRRL B-16210]|uniref:TIGR03086 family metal-binding protein n=1 Tax=Glycomyces sp. NRRL B-16210 TaxID=1463821 RepID=UPI00141517DD|nr:TIGR03086 family metal-binding protein [Glycomyces sp. NRRL B-16210]
MTDLLTLHRRTMANAAAIVDRVRPDQLGLPTPCAAWNLGQLLAHMTGQNRGFASAARGEDFDLAVWAETAAEEPGEAFAASAEEVVAAFAGDGATERVWPMLVGADQAARVPGKTALGYHFIDYVVHAWNVAAAIGVPAEFDEDVLAAVLPLAEEVPLEGPTRNGPYAPFAPAVPSHEGEGRLERLLAILGRDPAWAPED